MSKAPENKITPAPHLVGLEGYSVPRAKSPTDLKLDENEGISPPLSLLNDLAKWGPDLFCRYRKPFRLEALIARAWKIKPEQVLVTPGAEEAINRAARIYAYQGREVIVPVPSFEMAINFVRFSGGKIIQVPWSDCKFPIQSIIDAANENTGMIVLINPNNPTGFSIPADDIERLSREVPQALILVDLAYAPFADEDPTPRVLQLPNAIAVHTFSKACGMAGLRIGYTAGPVDIINYLRKTGGYYSVSTLSVALAERWFVEGEAKVKKTIRSIRQERDSLTAFLKQWGARPLDSQSSFLFSRFKDALWVRDALAGIGVAVRYIPSQPDFNEGLRISCPGHPVQFERLCHALQSALQPQALFFRIDDVIDFLSPGFLQEVSKRLPLVALSVESKGQALNKIEKNLGSNLFQMVFGKDEKESELNAEDICKAKEYMKVERAWMICSTPEDVRAARSNRIIPIAFLTGGDDREIQTEILYSAGAARVLNQLETVKDYLL